jgi:hypothetical protein
MFPFSLVCYQPGNWMRDFGFDIICVEDLRKGTDEEKNIIGSRYGY